MKKLTKNEKEQGKLIIEICEWMKANKGKTPSKKSKDEMEKKLGNRLSQIRQVKNRNIEGRSFNPVYSVIVEKYGFPELFELHDNQKVSENSVREICEWMKANESKSPSKKSKDKMEKKLGETLSAIKQSKMGKGNRVFYPSLQTIAEENGFPELFELHDNQKVSENSVREICEWMKANSDRKPNKKSKDSMEKSLGIKLTSIKQAKHSKGHRVFYPSLQTIAEEYGYPELFEYGRQPSMKLPKELVKTAISKKQKTKKSKQKV